MTLLYSHINKKPFHVIIPADQSIRRLQAPEKTNSNRLT